MTQITPIVPTQAGIKITLFYSWPKFIEFNYTNLARSNGPEMPAVAPQKNETWRHILVIAKIVFNKYGIQNK